MAIQDSTTPRSRIAPFAWRLISGLTGQGDVCGGLGIPQVPACYAVYFDGRLVYIGQSYDLHRRFLLHDFRRSYSSGFITPWGFFHDVQRITLKYKPARRYGEWAMRELRLIRRLEPKLNSRGGKRPQSDDGKAIKWMDRAYAKQIAAIDKKVEARRVAQG
jgi:hypothetical protein